MTLPHKISALLVLSCFAGSAWAQDEARCHVLRNTVIDAAFVTSARIVPADDTLPAYCQVRARALPEIGIEVRLPLSDWNGKLYETGCGGFCGDLGRADRNGGFINAMSPGLARGYATATSDGGHHGVSIIDASWAHHNPRAERDWGWRSIGETHRVAEALISAFYDATPESAIFQGCSTGGRMANMAALRYPETYAGIISGAPALDYPGLVATKMAWITAANTGPDGKKILKPGREQLVAAEVLAQCDGIDGAEDGVIADPRTCNVDLGGLQCTGETGPDCLSAAELDVIEKWRQGPQDSAGTQLYPGGIPEGSEPFWIWLLGEDGSDFAVVPAYVENFGAYMAFPEDPGPGWSPLDFEFDADPARLAQANALYNADDPDLSAFRAAGGKMIVWHGWADAIVTPYKTVDWYDKAAHAAGGEAALAENVALFMIPGLDHCGLLPGPAGLTQADLDPLGALEVWLETGTAPSTILAE
ncbi:MAG: tannase/feruloyl esterase family alpha/beta hydrolase [Pseudomonadota bacterium]